MVPGQAVPQGLRLNKHGWGCRGFEFRFGLNLDSGCSGRRVEESYSH